MQLALGPPRPPAVACRLPFGGKPEGQGQGRGRAEWEEPAGVQHQRRRGDCRAAGGCGQRDKDTLRPRRLLHHAHHHHQHHQQQHHLPASIVHRTSNTTQIDPCSHRKVSLPFHSTVPGARPDPPNSTPLPTAFTQPSACWCWAHRTPREQRDSSSTVYSHCQRVAATAHLPSYNTRVPTHTHRDGGPVCPSWPAPIPMLASPTNTYRASVSYRSQLVVVGGVGFRIVARGTYLSLLLISMMVWKMPT